MVHQSFAEIVWKDKESALYHREGLDIQTRILALKELPLRLSQQYQEAKAKLESALLQWKEQYILRAPAQGIAHFSHPFFPGQYIGQNQALLSIHEPHSEPEFELQLAQQQFGKIKEGQEVIIKLESFPYMEYGSIRGKLLSIYSVPEADGYFKARVQLPNGLRTTTGQQLSYTENLSEWAEIVVAKRSILRALFFDALRVWWADDIQHEGIVRLDNNPS